MFQENSISEEGGQALLNALSHNKDLKRLNLRGNPMSDETAHKIMSILFTRESPETEFVEDGGETGPSMTGILILILAASYLWRRQAN